MGIKQACDSSACGMTCHEQRACTAAGIFIEKSSKTGSHRSHHLASDRQKTRVAEVPSIILYGLAWVRPKHVHPYQKSFRRYWSGVDIHSPIHEGLTPSYGEDHAIHIVNWYRFNHHRFGAHPPIGVHKCFSFFASRLRVSSPRILSSNT